MATIYEKFGTTIVTLRTDKHISQEEFASLSDISTRYLSDIENGKRQFSLEYVEKIASALNISISQLFLAVENEK